MANSKIPLPEYLKVLTHGLPMQKAMQISGKMYDYALSPGLGTGLTHRANTDTRLSILLPSFQT